MSQRQDQSSTRALVGVWKCLGLGMSGVSLRALVLASVALALLGCTTPDAVRQFTAMATEGAAQSRPLVQDITASCIRKQLADRPLNEIADVTAEVTNTCSVTYLLGSIRAVEGLTWVVVPAETRYDDSDPDSVNDVSPKCMTSLSGRPESPGPLPQASPIEASPGTGISPAGVPSSSKTRSTECASCK